MTKSDCTDTQNRSSDAAARPHRRRTIRQAELAAARRALATLDASYSDDVLDVVAARLLGALRLDRSKAACTPVPPIVDAHSAPVVTVVTRTEVSTV